jgi:2,3-diketo-5-methylthio-1-phosphopentane phosphatase
LEPTQYNELANSLAQDLQNTPDYTFAGSITNPIDMVNYMVTKDLKVASLKTLQGQMWKDGYVKGELKGHVYSDTIHMLQWMSTHGVKVYIYSSGSVQAQKLLFGYSIHGNLTEFITHHFDITTSGNKKQSSSYQSICQDLNVEPSELVFVSDAEAELKAAKEAGIGQAIISIRPGNVPLTASGKKEFPAQIFSLLQLCGL